MKDWPFILAITIAAAILGALGFRCGMNHGIERAKAMPLEPAKPTAVEVIAPPNYWRDARPCLSPCRRLHR